MNKLRSVLVEITLVPRELKAGFPEKSSSGVLVCTFCPKDLPVKALWYIERHL